jgi:hypothetical protein
MISIRTRRLLAALLLLCTLLGSFAFAEDEGEIVEDVMLDEDAPSASADPAPAEEAPAGPAELTPRDMFIDDIIALGKELYDKADGKAQRAQYKGDIYVCKNFTVYLFRQNRGKYRMAEYPDVTLVIPNNLPAKKCKPYAYGFLWEDVPAEKGNPFYVAAQFRYDSKLSKAENMELALEFMRQVKRGDYFQMSADYEYGVGAHSAIMISDYDPATDTVHWMDSNMRGHKRNGIRYGIVQYDREISIEWWAKAFCHKKRGATLYRLRDDIVFADSVSAE